MGFLKNAIRNGISDGISKGLGEAVGKAAEKIVAPKVENYANAAAAQLDEATQAMNAASGQMAEAVQAADEAVKSAEAKPSGFASLENALSGWKQSAEQYATEMSKNMKQCPKCGEVTQVDEETLLNETMSCPKCGEPWEFEFDEDDCDCDDCED